MAVHELQLEGVSEGRLNFPSHSIRWGVAALLFATLVGGPRASGSPSAPDHAIDLLVIDRALADAKPSDPWVTFGDVGIKYADLRAYRDRLAGDTGADEADVVTPPGTTFKWPGGTSIIDSIRRRSATARSPPSRCNSSATAWRSGRRSRICTSSRTSPANRTTSPCRRTELGGGFSSSVGMDRQRGTIRQVRAGGMESRHGLPRSRSRARSLARTATARS